MPEHSAYRRRRQMVPRFHSVQADSRLVPPPPVPMQEPPERTAPPPCRMREPPPDCEKPLLPPELTALLHAFPERLKRLDGETLLLLGLLWMLWQEKADRRLLLALLYIML